MFSVVLFVTALIATSNGVEISPGNCESLNVNVVQNVDVAKYLGLWYEIRKYETTFQGRTCITAQYSLNKDNDSIVDVHNAELLSNGTPNTIDGSAYLADPSSGEGKLLVSFATTPVLAPYWVVDSDYTGYSVVWSCTNLANNEKMEFSWILSRSRTLTDAQENKIAQVLADNGIGDNFLNTDQSDETCADYYNSKNTN